MTPPLPRNISWSLNARAPSAPFAGVSSEPSVSVPMSYTLRSKSASTTSAREEVRVRSGAGPPVALAALPVLISTIGAPPPPPSSERGIETPRSTNSGSRAHENGSYVFKPSAERSTKSGAPAHVANGGRGGGASPGDEVERGADERPRVRVERGVVHAVRVLLVCRVSGAV